MSKVTSLWNAAKEAYRAARGLLSKNERNAAAAQAKKERGPVKAFFHITKNENVPAIEQQGLLTNHPNANINSAVHPFRKHGTDAGGVWVTTEPTAFPVYGTTIGGKNGNSAARADALSTIKIEVPSPELPKMKAVQDPYGKSILRKGNDPRAVEKFRTWAGIDVPTTVFLDDIKPQWLKNIGYVEEAPTLNPTLTLPTLHDVPSGWALSRKDGNLRWLDKNRLKEYTGYTGHRHGKGSYNKSPQRLVDEYIDKNQPIMNRLPEFPVAAHPNRLGRLQGATIRDNETNASKRFGNQPLAFDWSNEYRDYVKPGKSISKQRTHEFAPGTISRGIGGSNMSSVRDRNFNWSTYLEHLNRGYGPDEAAYYAAPKYVLDWDNIVYTPEMGYTPKKVKFRSGKPSFNSGHMSNAADYGTYLTDSDGNEMLAGNESLLKIKELIDMNGPEFYTDEMNLLSDGRPIKAIKDMEHPTWQETLRAIMKLRYLEPLE